MTLNILNDAWADYSPDIYALSAISDPMVWPEFHIAPRTYWIILGQEPRQMIFVVILRADGQPDFELPVSIVFMRIRDAIASYVKITTPDPLKYTDEILSRTDGKMVIYSGYKKNDGTRYLEELIYTNIQDIYFDEGSSNNLNLVGTRYITHQNPRQVELKGISSKSKDENDRYRIKCALDFFIKPMDIISFDGVSFVADMLSITLLSNDAYMEIEGE